MELAIDRLTKQYKNKIAVDRVSIKLKPGVYGLLGANGAGKTTLMRMICDIQNPTSGQIKYNGTDIKKLGEDYRQVLGYLPQDFGYYPDFTAYDFLMYIAVLKGLSKEKAEMRVNELLQIVNLENEKKQKVKTFSGGMKQRLGIAQAMLNNPKILILDEPTAGLDPKERVKFRNLISSFSQDKIVILSTHIVSDIEFIADEIIVMKAGKKILTGTPEELLQDLRGSVWKCVAYDKKEVEMLNHKYCIINIHQENNTTELRIVSRQKPTVNAVNIEPNLEDLYSLCHREHFKISKENLASAINRIAKKNNFNPVQEYLDKCLLNYDKSGMYIKMLCDTINTPITFDDEVKELYITKWLLNVVNIAFNKGQYGSEGILVIQGPQGLGKTRWIKSIIPNEKWVKTGLEIDPSDKDKVYQATKYWVTELGELDATLKKDQAKLKAFFTESMDEYRKPYERFTEAYPRLTAFYATVNKEEFLKDETGNRRYWVIPATNILVDHEIDLDQLWGEVMYLLKVKQYPHWLTNDNKELLKITNEAFEVKDETYLRIQDGFQWSIDKDFWDEYTSTELCDLLNIKNFTSLKTTLEKFGVKQKRTTNRRYYLLPPVNSHVSIRNENKRWGA